MRAPVSFGWGAAVAGCAWAVSLVLAWVEVNWGWRLARFMGEGAQQVTWFLLAFVFAANYWFLARACRNSAVGTVRIAAWLLSMVASLLGALAAAFMCMAVGH